MTTEGVIFAPPVCDQASRQSSWTPLGRVAFRVAFRIAFLYFLFFGFISRNGNLFDLIPVVGGWINNALLWLPDHASLWIGQHVFHLTGLAANWQPTGSGDSGLNWIEYGLFVVIALFGGLLWSLVAALCGNRRTEYATLYAWLRFLLRLTCGGFMLIYGYSKVLPLQMAPLSIGILNEPVGNMSPMTMLWGLIGLHPLYEIICGLAEVIRGILILFRRTAQLGALVSAFVMTNVLLFNMFFDARSSSSPPISCLPAFFWLCPIWAHSSASSGCTNPPQPQPSGSHPPPGAGITSPSASLKSRSPSPSSS